MDFLPLFFQKNHNDSSDLLTTLRILKELLENIEGFEYTLDLEKIDDFNTDFKLLYSDGDIGDPLIEGETYCQQNSENDIGYYSIQWPIFCSITDFIKAVTVWPFGSESELSNNDFFEIESPVSDDSFYWTQGLVFWTNRSCYGLPLNFLHKEGQDILHPKNLLDFLRKNKKLKEGEDRIDECRINTANGDISIELIVAPEQSYRYLKILSHLNLTHVILKLYGATSNEFLLKRKLKDKLDIILKQFPKIEK